MKPSFRSYILSIMKGRRGGAFAAIVKGVLRILSWIYAIAIKIVDFGYKSGIRRKHKAPIPVVSVGNITLGGTGKTPFTIFLATHFSDAGKKPGVLTRGYGDDERRMLRDELPDVPIFIGQDRVRNAAAAARDERGVIVLDDGFQHRRIERDLNILLLDSDSPFGNGSLFPRGILREPVSSVKRADVLVLAKIDRIGQKQKESIISELNTLAPEKLIVTARHKPLFLKDVTGAVYPLEDLKGGKVCLVSGIADPEYFAFEVKNLGAEIFLRYDYADHHDYRQKEIDKISNDVRDKGIEKIVTTRKDYVKMQLLDLSRIEQRLFVLEIAMDIVDGKEALIGRLNSVVSG